MRTTFQARQPYADRFLSIAEELPANSPARPERFMRIMKNNRGGIGALTGLGLDQEGLEYKNPVICALGDSVTAGHFESLVFCDPAAWFGKVLGRAGMDPSAVDPAIYTDPAKLNAFLGEVAARIPAGEGFPPVEIIDSRESYLEKFRMKLIDRHEETSVSAINSGIAGDNLIMMEKRMQRDVLHYDPDLILINGSLNWSEEMGTTAFYKDLLTGVVNRAKQESSADIILLTPNGMVGDEKACALLDERVRAIREVAGETGVCLADTYAVWEEARAQGCPWSGLLSNGINHPGREGHEVYAITLMKLFD